VLVLPLPLLLIVLFTLGLALALCSLAMFFNDVIHFFGALLMIWFYLTPIVYPLDTIPAQYRFLIWLNPLTWFVEAFRAPIYNGVLPDLAALLIATCISLVTFAIGWFIFSRSADRFIYYL
jgi:homopolymeric O-antigen transport system permease protein